MESDFSLRVVTPEDAEALLEVYAPYVTDTAISFEWQVPILEEFRDRIRRTLEKYPYLAAVRGEEILGYACTHPFVGRTAYDWGAETTIYLRRDCCRRGWGKLSTPPWRESPWPSISTPSMPASAGPRRRTNI